MFGRFVLAPVWESRSVQAIRRPLAAMLTSVRRRREIRRENERLRCASVDAINALPTASGSWVMVYTRSKVPGARFKARCAIVDSIDPSQLPVSLGIDASRHDIRVVSLQRGGAALASERTEFVGHVVLPRRGGKILAFDLDSRTVLHHVPQPGFTESYRNVRDAFARHVPSVPYRVLPAGTELFEPLVEGLSLAQLPPDHAIEGVCELLRVLPDVMQERAKESSHHWLEQILDAADDRDTELSRRRDILSWLGSAPLVPAQGDLNLENVILTPSGPACIDFGAACELPSWFDGMSLVLSLVRYHGVQPLVGSDAPLDGSLEQFLTRTTGSEIPERWRSLLALVGSAHLKAKAPRGLLNDWVRSYEH